MHPTIVNIGTFAISSFGFFLAVAFLAAIFVIWRLCRVYDISEEQTLDITFLTFFGGLVGARLFFVLTNPNLFDSLLKILLINRYPGLNFWGGIIIGLLSLKLLVNHFKLHFWQIADFVTVGVFASLILGSFGCLLGSCQYGIVSSFPLSVSQVGVLENRFPIQLVSSILYLMSFLNLWKICLRFHFNGKVTALGLIYLGLIKFFTDYLRGDTVLVLGGVGVNQVFAIAAFIFGLYIIYTQGKRSVREDLLFVPSLFTDKRNRKLTLLKLQKAWYNRRVNWKVSLSKSRKTFVIKTKSILKNLNVTKNPPQF